MPQTTQVQSLVMLPTCDILGPVQTSNFTCAESNANEKNLLFSLICIRFGTCEVRRLNRALALVHFLTLCLLLYRSCPSFWSRPRTLEIITLAWILLMREECAMQNSLSLIMADSRSESLNLCRHITLRIGKHAFSFALRSHWKIN